MRSTSTLVADGYSGPGARAPTRSPDAPPPKKAASQPPALAALAGGALDTSGLSPQG
ncbi:hypothetical protein [Streptomyces sp. NPDC051000]|uniref:hypothetical protein n=1 Tax=unclassified Streptomyces TaxID=2593676 RepID=UPI0033DCDA43